MRGIALAGGADLLVVGLALLTALLFALAIRFGRWPLWVLGYLAALLTLGGAFFIHEPGRSEPQRSPVTGVVEYVRHRAGRPAPASPRDASSANASTTGAIDERQAWGARVTGHVRPSGMFAMDRPDDRARAGGRNREHRATRETP